MTLYHFPSSTSCISEIFALQFSLKRPHRDGMSVLKKGNLKSSPPQVKCSQAFWLVLLASATKRRRKKKTKTETVSIGVLITSFVCVFRYFQIYKRYQDFGFMFQEMDQKSPTLFVGEFKFSKYGSSSCRYCDRQVDFWMRDSDRTLL